MLVSVNISSPDFPDRSYSYDLRAGEHLLTMSGSYHEAPCEPMDVTLVLRNLRDYVVEGQEGRYPSPGFCRRNFYERPAGDFTPVRTNTSVTFRHEDQFFTFGLIFREAACVGEWLDCVRADGSLLYPVSYVGERPGGGSVLRILDQQEDSVEQGFGQDTNLIHQAGKSVYGKPAASADEERALGIGVAWHWFSTVLTFPGEALMLETTEEIARDFTTFRAMCTRLLPSLGAGLESVEQQAYPLLDLLNGQDARNNLGHVTQWQHPDTGRQHWLLPRNYTVLSFAPGELPTARGLLFISADVIPDEGVDGPASGELTSTSLPTSDTDETQTMVHVGTGERFQVPRAPLSEGLDALFANDGSTDPPAGPEETAGEASNEGFEDTLSQQLADLLSADQSEPSSAPTGIPFGALNPAPADELEEAFDDFDAIDFEDDDEAWNFEDFEYDDLTDQLLCRYDGLSDELRDVVYRLPEFELAITGGKVVVMPDLGYLNDQQNRWVAGLLRHLLTSPMTGQLIFSTGQLGLIDPEMVRRGGFAYQVKAKDKNPSAEPEPRSWQVIPPGMVGPDDGAVRALLRMLFPTPPPLRPEDVF